ncbi:hypothetical protein EV695_0454 [Cocleimonas flava]|uniref:Uncharacterized protein n=1 Tax=Cocleimonas flava TaxID=634765 RepID=A0A4R1F316_9GAMM|nr:hypothetical protein EV695_0454 [Cocleimonas flava]
MACLIKNLLGLTSLKNDDNCEVLPPIVRSLVGSTLFIILMAIASHLIRV